jgi:hypothetical protein
MPWCATTALAAPPPGPVWECAAGDARLVAAMRAVGRTVIASDVLPAAAGIQRHNFLFEPSPAAAQ